MGKVGGFFSRISKFFREIKVELKKVVWPTWSQIRNNTGIVIVCIIIIGIGIWVLDAIFGWGATSLLAK